MDEIKKVKEPDTVIYYSSSANLGLSLPNGDKKLKLNWKNGKLELHKVTDKDTIKLLDSHLESMWLKNEKGEYELDENGNPIIRAGAMNIPIRKYDAFPVATEPVRLEVTKGDFVEISPEKIIELIKKEELEKSKKKEK